MKLIYTAGVFDLLHRGHINLLWASRQLGDVLVVGVVSDAGARAYKGRYPAQPYPVRAQAISRLGFVDVVVFQAGTDPSANLATWRPDVMTHGDDWAQLKEGHATLAELGVAFVLLPYTPGISTTLLREAGAA